LGDVKALGSENGKGLGKMLLLAEDRSRVRVLLPMIGINFDIDIGRAALGGNFDLILGGLHVKHAVQRGIWVPIQHLL
jgi:hypothetical protein